MTSKVRNFRVISQEQVLVTDSSEMLEKFSVFGPQFERVRISFEKFSGLGYQF